MLQAVVVYGGVRLAFGVSGYAVVNLVFVLLWLLVAAAIYREHKKATSQ